MDNVLIKIPGVLEERDVVCLLKRCGVNVHTIVLEFGYVCIRYIYLFNGGKSANIYTCLPETTFIPDDKIIYLEHTLNLEDLV